MNILIADDEKPAREGIHLMVEQSPYTFDNIFVASDGNEAAKIIKEKPIDIVLTDICMPGTDGLELSQTIRRQYPEVQIILITSYSEFEYVQKAIQLGVMGYLLKPISDVSLYQILGKAVKKLLSDKNPNNFDYMTTALNHIFLSNLKKETVSKMYANLFPKNSQYRLAVIKCNCGKDADTIFQALKLIINSHFTQFDLSDIYCIQNSNNPYEVFILHTNVQNDNSFIRFVTEIKELAESKLGGVFLTLFSCITDYLSGKLYQMCLMAYDERMIRPNETIFYYEPDNQKQLLKHIETQINQLDFYIISKNLMALQAILNEIFSKENAEEFHNIRLIFFVTSNTIINALNKIQIYLHNSDLNSIFSGEILNNAKNLDELSDFFFALVKNHLNEHGLLHQSCKDIVHEIKDYINLKYAENLTEKDISTVFSITPTYMSQLFRKEYSVTFVNYLTDVRINKACDMLKNTDIKISDIASMIGYTDKQYFHKVFKKKTGMTPMMYRMEHLK